MCAQQMSQMHLWMLQHKPSNTNDYIMYPPMPQGDNDKTTFAKLVAHSTHDWMVAGSTPSIRKPWAGVPPITRRLKMPLGIKVPVSGKSLHEKEPSLSIAWVPDNRLNIVVWTKMSLHYIAEDEVKP